MLKIRVGFVCVLYLPGFLVFPVSTEGWRRLFPFVELGFGANGRWIVGGALYPSWRVYPTLGIWTTGTL